MEVEMRRKFFFSVLLLGQILQAARSVPHINVHELGLIAELTDYCTETWRCHSCVIGTFPIFKSVHNLHCYLDGYLRFLRCNRADDRQIREELLSNACVEIGNINLRLLGNSRHQAGKLRERRQMAMHLCNVRYSRIFLFRDHDVE